MKCDSTLVPMYGPCYSLANTLLQMITIVLVVFQRAVEVRVVPGGYVPTYGLTNTSLQIITIVLVMFQRAAEVRVDPGEDVPAHGPAPAD